MLQPLAALTWPALRGVSFGVEAGTTLGIIGANGAGKSTLLRVLATLLIPTRGRALVGGFDVERTPARVRQFIGMHTGSDAGFYARLTGRQNLQFFAALNNLSPCEAQQRIEATAHTLDLGDSLDRQVRTLSTGMVQRLGLARALLHRPAVLLLDEPTRSLDPLTAQAFRRTLRDELVRKQGTAVLFSSHSLQEVAELADRVAVLDAGCLLACDALTGLLASTGAATLEQALEKLVPRGRRLAEPESDE